MTFDPYTNAEIEAVFKEHLQEGEFTQEMLKDHYKLSVTCLLRIKDSIDLWEKRSGSNGYFQFIEEYMGDKIRGTERKFSVLL